MSLSSSYIIPPSPQGLNCHIAHFLPPSPTLQLLSAGVVTVSSAVASGNSGCPACDILTTGPPCPVRFGGSLHFSRPVPGSNAPVFCHGHACYRQCLSSTEEIPSFSNSSKLFGYNHLASFLSLGLWPTP